PVPPPGRDRPPRLGLAGPRPGCEPAQPPEASRRRDPRGRDLHLLARPLTRLGEDRRERRRLQMGVAVTRSFLLPVAEGVAWGEAAPRGHPAPPACALTPALSQGRGDDLVTPRPARRTRRRASRPAR